jgi:hypothetical protein
MRSNRSGHQDKSALTHNHLQLYREYTEISSNANPHRDINQDLIFIPVFMKKRIVSRDPSRFASPRSHPTGPGVEAPQTTSDNLIKLHQRFCKVLFET